MKNRVLIALAMLLAVTGCRRPHTPAPPATRGVTIQLQDATTGLDMDGTVTMNGVSLGVHNVGRIGDLADCPTPLEVSVSASGYVSQAFTRTAADVACGNLDGPEALLVKLVRDVPPPPVFTPRTGQVFNLNRVYADQRGPFLSLGTSLFWELWGLDHDRARLVDHNLTPIATRGLQDVRVLLVLPPDGLWSIRRVDPFAPTFQSIVARAVDLNYNDFGLRTGITIFGGRVGTDDDHARIVQSVCSALAGRQDRITHVEVANEGGNNGFGKDELWRHAAALRACLPGTLIALTSAENYGNDPGEIYEGSPATMFAFHPDRDINGDGGIFRPSRQPYGYREFRVPSIGENGEPRGPQSSITETSDPVVIAADAVMTWLSGWGRYVFHTGPGVFGVSPQDAAAIICTNGRPCDNHGRPANWDETPNVGAIADALVALSRKLPQDLPAWGRLTHANPSKQADWPFITETGKQWDRAFNEHSTRGYAVWQGNHFLAIVLKLEAPIDVIAKGQTTFRVRSVLTYDVLAEVTLAPGAGFSLPVYAPAVILEGTVD